MNTPLKEKRLKIGISLRELARTIKVDSGELSKLENGKRLGTLFVWFKIWNYFDWTPEEFTDIIYEHYTIFTGGDNNDA